MKPILIVVFQILNSKLTDTFFTSRDSHGGGKMVFVRESLMKKRLNNLKTKFSEAICVELTASNTKWFMLFAYTPCQENNLSFLVS